MHFFPKRECTFDYRLVIYVLEAVERVPMSSFQVNERGTGSAQHHPRMMLALLIYCHANGIFGSRRIERATYRDLGVRHVAADCHPDHDTIRAFRRRNIEAVGEAFLQVMRQIVFLHPVANVWRQQIQLRGIALDKLRHLDYLAAGTTPIIRNRCLFKLKQRRLQ